MCTSIDPCSVPAKSKMRSLPSRSVGTSLVRTCALGTYCNLLVLSLRFEREYFIGADQHIEHFWENVSSRSVCHYTGHSWLFCLARVWTNERTSELGSCP
ncbi:hypothetical protein QYF36_000196 [Acer negundo]|nr:hypothetical protein QYF36_000196 [Acer negundo]